MSRPPLTAVPAQRSSRVALATRRRLVVGVCAATSVVGLLSGIAWMTHDPAPVVASSNRSEQAVSLATAVVNDFVAGRDSAVPAADGVDTTFSHSSAGAFPDAQVTLSGVDAVRIGDKLSAVLQQVSFLVRVPRDGQTDTMYTVSVSMMQMADGWVLAAAPALEPTTVSAGGPALDYSSLYTNGGTASELAGLEWGQAVIDQAQRWAQVFAAAGAADADLFALTGDTNAAHTYTGLGGWGVQSATVTSFTTGPNGEVSAKTFGSTWVSVRVALVLTPPGANGPTLSTEYDLLLQPEANPAAPPVTSWGPAGVGPTQLTNYSTANNG